MLLPREEASEDHLPTLEPTEEADFSVPGFNSAALPTDFLLEPRVSANTENSKMDSMS